MTTLLGVLALLVASSASERPQAQTPSVGSICLAPVKDTGDPRGYVSSAFSVRVDKGKWTPLPDETSTLIPAVTLDRRHLISIRDGETIIESFWFTFASFESTTLCLWYKPWYRTWSLWDADAGGKKCRCAAAESRGAR